MEQDELDQTDEDMEEICAGCGIEQSGWKGNDGRGYTVEGLNYCCKECAEEIECTCGL